MKKSFAKDGTRLRHPEYLEWIMGHVCWICGGYPCEAAHGKAWAKSIKGPDFEALAECRKCHDDKHHARTKVDNDKREATVKRYNEMYCWEKAITLEELRGKIIKNNP